MILNLKFSKYANNYTYVNSKFTDEEDDEFSVYGNNFNYEYFHFFKSINVLLKKKKLFLINIVISKKKSSVFKRFNSIKKFLFKKTRKFLYFNKDLEFEPSEESFALENNLKIKRLARLHDFFKQNKRNYKSKWGNKTKIKRYYRYNEFKSIRMRKGFFSILLENRKIIKNFFCLKNKKQKFINKLLTAKTHIPQKKIYTNFEFNIVNILLRSQFFFFKADAVFFLQKGCVFLNGQRVFNINTTCVLGDRVQLVICQNYYFYFRTKKNFLTLFLKKLNKKYYRSLKVKLDFYKQRSRYYPNWVFKMIHFYNDVPSFLEIDFTIMTSIIFTKPHFFYDFNILN